MSLPSEIVVAAIGLVGIFVTALVSLMTAMLQRNLKSTMDEVNDAVNNKHKKGYTGAPKLYDLAIANHSTIAVLHEKVDELIEWKDSYANGPMDTGSKVLKFVEDTNQRMAGLDEKIENCGCPYRLQHGPQPPDVNCGRGLPKQD